VAELFEKQRANFYYNWLSFIEDFLKSFLVFFLMGHSVYIHIYSKSEHYRPFAILDKSNETFHVHLFAEVQF